MSLLHFMRILLVSLLLVWVPAASVSSDFNQLNGLTTATFFLTNDDNGAIYNSATIDLLGVFGLVF